MNDYHDSYFATADAAAFFGLLAGEANLIGPAYGNAEVPGSDPALLYIAVRSRSPLAVPPGAEVADPAVAQAVLGVWA